MFGTGVSIIFKIRVFYKAQFEGFEFFIRWPYAVFVGPLQRVRPRNGILALVVVLVVLVVVLPLRSEFIGEL